LKLKVYRMADLSLWQIGRTRVRMLSTYIKLSKDTRVRIPPGFKVFRKNIAALLCIKWLNMRCLCVERGNTCIAWPQKFF
jgi:hypothetical protein